MSLAGLNGAILDRGGPYRLRAAMLLALAIASAIATLSGTLLAGHLVLAVIVTFVFALVCGLLRAWVEVGVGFGVTLLVTYAVALAVPAPSFAAAAMRAVYIAIGGLWATLLAVVVWPLRPYQPVRIRVADCYRAIAEYIGEGRKTRQAAETTDPTDGVSWTFPAHRVALRTSLEAARTALALSRRGRGSETGRGERLLMLHELADQLSVHVVALLEMASDATPGWPSEPRRELEKALDDITEAAESVADAIESETGAPHLTIDWNGDALRAAIGAARSPLTADDEYAAALLDRTADYAGAAASVVETLNSGDPEGEAAGSVPVTAAWAEPPRLFSIASILRPQSLVLHHALRVATVTSLAVLITGLLRLPHGYWVTLTVVVILQPYTGATTQKAMQRVAGTIVGALAAAVLTILFHGSVAILILIGVFTAACIAFLPLNYGAYAVFGTPAFVMLAELTASEWNLSGLRVVNTLIGGGLALAGSRWLWPGAERDRLPEFAAAALRANREYLRLAVDMIARGADANIGVLRDARRNIAVAASNEDESFQRLIGEHRGPVEELEPIMALLVYTRRFAASTAALAIAGVAAAVGAPSGDPIHDALAPFEHTATAVLEDLADSVEHHRAPAPFPPIGSVPLPSAETPAPVRAQVTRLARQLQLLHDAVNRWTAATPGQLRQALTPAQRTA